MSRSEAMLLGYACDDTLFQLYDYTKHGTPIKRPVTKAELLQAIIEVFKTDLMIYGVAVTPDAVAKELIENKNYGVEIKTDG